MQQSKFYTKVSKYIDWLTNPIIENIGIFMGLITFQVIYALIYLWGIQETINVYESLKETQRLVMYGFVFAWAILLIYKRLGKLGGVIFTLYLLVLSVFQLAEIVCIFLTHRLLSIDFVGVAAATNIDEVSDFFQTSSYFNVAVVCEMIFCIFLPIAFYYIYTKLAHHFKHSIDRTSLRVGLVCLLFISLPFCIRYRETKSCDVTLYGRYMMLKKFNSYPDIVPLNPALDLRKATNVPTVVVIIGESLSKQFCSLYGYNKETTPILEQMPDSLLHLFKSVESPSTYTIASFSRFMTISDSQSVATCFQTPNIVEIAKLSGYKFTWISNQSEKGIHDNAITKFANLADTAIWNGNKFAGMRRINKDGELINILKHYKSDAQHNVILVHLMGSHESFYKRYPSEFGKFKSNQYLSYPQNQRTQRAQYDNSILYNDYVVSSIMELYANEDVAVIYFSDHGLDVFGSDPTYCAHARVGDEKSINFAKQIPFMIYTSSKFRANHGNLVGMIEKSVNKQYNTTDFPFMFMQLIGVTFKDRENKYPLQ